MDSELTHSVTVCSLCKNHISNTVNCKAFPNGIPKKILFGENDHAKPFKGDNGIQFEPIEESTQKTWDLDITKTDDDQRLVFGWLSVAKDAAGNEVIDLQGDVIDPEELEKAAYKYILESREAGDSHKRYEGIGKIIVSIVTTKEIQKAMGIPDGILPEGWFVGYHIDDEKVWKLIKSGEYQSFSIGGTGKRIPIVEKHLPGKHDQKSHGNGGGARVGERKNHENVEYKEVDPNDIKPVNKITDKEKYNQLADDLSNNGWNGRDVLVIEMGENEYQALTGSHRIYAARKAEIDIPATIIKPPFTNFFTEPGSKERDVQEAWEKLLQGGRNEDDLITLKDLYKLDQIPKNVVDLMQYEVDNS